MSKYFAGWFAAAAVALASAPVAGALLTVSCGNETPGFEQCAQRANEWAASTENSVKVISTPNETNEVLALYLQLLSAKSPDLDAFPVDIVWPGMLASHLLPLHEFIPEEDVAQHFPAYLQSNTVDGALLALPWFADVGLLYYRKDLLDKYGAEVPSTWAELQAVTQLIQSEERKLGADRLWGYVFQGRAYEGLTCNALEWLDSFNGGRFVAPNGMVSLYNQKAVDALSMVAGFVGQISPKGVLNYAEEEVRGSFQAGYAVFMRNWPYAYALVNGEDSPIRGQVGVAPLPKGGVDGKHSGTLGGWSMAVSRYSKHPELAADLIRHITARESQKVRAIEYSYNPTIPELYDDPDIQAANPFMAELVAMLGAAAGRPTNVTGRHYNRVSSEIWNTVHDVLSGRAEAQDALQRLEKVLERLSRRNRWD